MSDNLIPVNTMGYYDEETKQWVPIDAVALKSENNRFTADDISQKFNKIGDIDAIKATGNTLSEKIINEFNYRGINISWLGAKGDGTTDDSSVFSSIESTYQDKVFDLAGKTYVVNSFPNKNKYLNGYFIIDGNKYFSGYVSSFQTGNSNIIIGNNAAKNFRPGDQYKGIAGHNIIAIGENALSNASEYTKNTTAIGAGALFNNKYGVYNLAIGLQSQYYVTGVQGDAFKGTRNTSVGDNSMRFNKDGYSNVAMGRNALQTNEKSIWNTALGAAAMSGYAPLNLDSKTIINNSPQTAGYQVAVGTNSLYWSNGIGNVGVGVNAGREIKNSQRNVAMGYYAMSQLDSDVSFEGKQRFFPSIQAGYTWIGQDITLTHIGHTFIVGQNLSLALDGGEKFSTTVKSITVDTFTVSTAQTAQNEISGMAQVSEYYTTTGTYVWKDNNIQVSMGNHPFQNGYKVLMSVGGREAIYFTVANSTSSGFTVSTDIIGDESGAVKITEYSDTTPMAVNYDNTAIGVKAAWKMKKGSFNTAIGGLSLENNKGDYNTALGYMALKNNTTGNQNTALGYGALRFTTGGDEMKDISNSTGVGFNSRVSGSNQIQLGDGNSTPYSFNALQNRSDLRDKADIRDTVLGLDFINKVRPVDYKWDIRDEYVEIKEDGTVITHERDGSKKKNRYHHGVIAQEIQKVIEAEGIDFGGFQHHELSGGEDVMSIGYTEFIAPLIKAVQELSAKVDEQAKEIAALKKA
ncbi:tail fiber domain-containing protein [Bacillus rugosus]|uniref:tail fiber domain-containing protein n=1 Tax=Bacillus rugosus TaxID=2715209 RepID=UPI00141E6DB3|nr:tail fiber domain-containing protein [Bacillus rugosus]NUF05648.1 tail fiber domain-containing protein [Bacillus rugosus]